MSWDRNKTQKTKPLPAWKWSISWHIGPPPAPRTGTPDSNHRILYCLVGFVPLACRHRVDQCNRPLSGARIGEQHCHFEPVMPQNANGKEHPPSWYKQKGGCWGEICMLPPAPTGELISRNSLPCCSLVFSHQSPIIPVWVVPKLFPIFICNQTKEHVFCNRNTSTVIPAMLFT